MSAESQLRAGRCMFPPCPMPWKHEHRDSFAPGGKLRLCDKHHAELMRAHEHYRPDGPPLESPGRDAWLTGHIQGWNDALEWVRDEVLKGTT